MNPFDWFTRKKVLGFGLFMLFGGLLNLGLAAFGYSVEFFRFLVLPEWMIWAMGGFACFIGFVAVVIAWRMKPTVSQ
jgi:hypothetical protein